MSKSTRVGTRGKEHEGRGRSEVREHEDRGRETKAEENGENISREFRCRPWRHTELNEGIHLSSQSCSVRHQNGGEGAAGWPVHGLNTDQNRHGEDVPGRAHNSG